MITSRLRRAAVAAAGAALLTLGASAATAAGVDHPNGAHDAGADRPAVSPLFPPGSELQFVAVAPCRIIDTRASGGALVSGQRTFDATMASYATQGGKAGSCKIPDGVASVQLNLGAISQNGKTSDIKGWAAGTAEPTASLVNYNPSGPVANMVTMPVNASGQFTLKTPGAAHVFADVAGFYVKPLYAFITSSGSVYQSAASGLLGVTRVSTGRYDLTFDRDVTRCAVTTASLTWATNTDVSADNQDGWGTPNVVRVGIVNGAGSFTDEYFYVALTC